MSDLSRCGRLLLALGAASLAACSSSKRVAPVTTGNISVTIIPANAVTPAVVVTGPQGYNKAISTSQVLTNLPFGEYTVTGDSVVGVDSVVGAILDTAAVTGRPVTLSSHDTVSSRVTYGFKRRTGGLWVANNMSGTIPEYAASQLRDTGVLVPAETLATTASGPQGLAIDTQGDMWLSDFNTDTLFMFSAADRNSRTTTPTRKLWCLQIASAEYLAFDAQGNLWVADADGLALEFTAAQLTAGGLQVATVQINGSAGSAFAAVTLDTAGSLWVSDNGNNRILEYSASQLSPTGPTCAGSPVVCTPVPVDTVGATTNSLNSPSGIAFDGKGDLWVANNSGSTIVEFTPAQLASNGAPAPQVTITTPNLSIPNSVAIDNSGSVWVSDGNNGAIYSYTTAQTASTGSPAPAVQIHGALASYVPAQLAFDPFSTTTTLLPNRVRPPTPGFSRRGRVSPRLRRAMRALGIAG